MATPDATQPTISPAEVPANEDTPVTRAAPIDAAPATATPAAVLAPPGPPAQAFVYALGQIDARFPSMSIEKEFAQVIGTPENAGLNDRQTVKRAMETETNRYLARSMCWVFVIEGIDTYILVPRDPADYTLLLDSYREEPRRDDLDLVIGVRSHIAPPEVCNGLALPVVVFDQLYSFDRDSLIAGIPKPDSVSGRAEAKFRSAAGRLFDELVQLADNAGAIGEHRALNYLTVRYPRIYTRTTERFDLNFSFAGVEVRPSRLSGPRTIVDVILSYRHRETDVVEKEYVRVDVTEEFPFLVTKLGNYYDR